MARPPKTKNSTNKKEVPASASIKGSIGIIQDQTSSSPYFDTTYYGPKRVVSQPAHWLLDETSHVDHIEYWERAMGRFWIRSQIAHYLWNRPSRGLSTVIKERLPSWLPKDDDDVMRNHDKHNKDTRFIGMHIRYSDNIFHLKSDFGRDPTVTRDLKHYFQIAQEIRNTTGISTIYVATDSATKIKELEKYQRRMSDWTIHIQEKGVPRTKSQDFLWFANKRSVSAPGIATDVEILRRADYLIGSFQSNVYRLVTELNTAYHIGRYLLSTNRHRTVDVEWYEDP
jgi:hypothetical protein